jgi:Zn-dependent protease with chaperone function
MDITYPSSPVQQTEITVSPSFKKQVAKVIASIVLFCIVYIALMVAIFALAIGAGYLGIFVIIAHPAWLTLLLGAGIIATGISLIYFIIKFIGTVAKRNNTGSIQIYQEDHPALFEFLEKVASETGTVFPKKVFISPDVNAAVYYNSSFLSMFFPIRKNLEIGLGLVNCVNVSEFKAIVAHEFGHFSQRSMKVGSFTYNVNLVLYNILYENTNYTHFLQQWGNLHGLLALFASATIKISRFIQWILRGMYKLINKEYSALRREMEFHADGIAASVAGGNNLVSALAKLEVAEACYQKSLQDANEWLGKNRQVYNIFQHQSVVIKQVSEDFKFNIHNGIPDINYEVAKSVNTSRINLKNQWASHPSLQERKEYLDSLPFNSAPVNHSTWGLFNEPEKLQQLVTDTLYREINSDSKREFLELTEYEEWINTRRESKQLPKIYKGFYDGRYFTLSNEYIVQPDAPIAVRSFEEIFSQENGKIQSEIISLQSDIATVEAIRDKNIEVKSFDFDGQKFVVSDAEEVLNILTADLNKLINKQAQLDKEAYNYFYLHSPDKEKLKTSYRDFNDFHKFSDQYFNDTAEVYAIFQRVSQTITIENAVVESDKLKKIDQEVIKPAISKILDKKIALPESDAQFAEKLAAFQTKSYQYFHDTSFMENELEELFSLNNEIRVVLQNSLFDKYKILLNEQIV